MINLNKDYLSDLVNKLSEVKPNLDEINERFKTSDRYCNITEIYLRVSLEQICKELDYKIAFDPIKHGDKTANYIFEVGNRRLLVMKKKSRTSCTDIDELLIIENIPFLFEVKSKGEPKKYLDKELFVTLIHCELPSIRRKVKPIKEYFNTDRCGFILIKYAYSKPFYPTKTIMNLKDNGKEISAKPNYPDWVIINDPNKKQSESLLDYTNHNLKPLDKYHFISPESKNKWCLPG